MINNNELRRGNYVAHAPTSGGKLPEGLRGAFKVDEIRYASFSATRLADGLPFSIFYPEAEGIPLTREILEAIGFKKVQFYVERVGIGHRWEVGKFSLLFNGVTGVFYYPHRDTYLPNLHQLQNLFFALIGEELPVNLKDL